MPNLLFIGILIVLSCHQILSLAYERNDAYGRYNANKRTYTTQNVETGEDDSDFMPKLIVIETDRLLWPFSLGTEIFPPFGMKRSQTTNETENCDKTKPLLWSGNFGIKDESKLEYKDIVYIGYNETALDEVKKSIKVLTVPINSENGLNLMHMYKSIYLYNIWPHITMVNGKPQLLMKRVSTDQAVKERQYQRYQPAQYQRYQPSQYQRYQPKQYQRYQSTNYQRYQPTQYQRYQPKQYQRYQPTQYQRYQPRQYQKSFRYSSFRKNTDSQYENSYDSD